MGFFNRVFTGVIKFLFTVTCRIDWKDLKKIPLEGPGILITNHTTYFEAPLYYVYTRPRKAHTLGKKELWNNWLAAKILDSWGAIPISRGDGDLQAMRSCMNVLKSGHYLGVAPEGTRSKTGELIQGKPGVTFFATQMKVPIYPMVQWGLENLGKNLKRLKRTSVTLRVGRPFFLEKKTPGRITSEERQKMADEMMYQIASLMPEALRGFYRDLSRMTTDYITFADA